jgi:glutathione synthase/RimK-type ligase-like ATP-grasp enzyme
VKIKKVNKPEILLISNKLDFTTDYVCLELDKRQAQYLRVNRDEFSEYSVSFKIDPTALTIERNGIEFLLTEPYLKSIYFRAPIYLRDIYQPGLPEQSQLYRTQWAAFLRNLTIFEKPLWVNNPIATFKAENKLLQLKYARMVGLACPITRVANRCPINITDDADYIVKSIDTAVLRIENHEAFVYSNKIKGRELKAAELSIAPIIIQDYIYPKIDMRVTVVGESVYPVKILVNGCGVEGDWRQIKDNVQFVECDLPKEISKSCIDLTKSLGLSFSAIDLIESGNDIYFLELNPTGEWGWLVHSTGLPIHKAICDCLELGHV